MTTEEVKVRKTEMEQKISDAMKEFEDETGLKVGSVGFSRCTKSNGFGIDEDYNYNTQTKINL